MSLARPEVIRNALLTAGTIVACAAILLSKLVPGTSEAFTVLAVLWGLLVVAYASDDGSIEIAAEVERDPWYEHEGVFRNP